LGGGRKRAAQWRAQSARDSIFNARRRLGINRLSSARGGQVADIGRGGGGGFRNLAAAIIQIQTCPIARALVALCRRLNPNFRRRRGLKRNSERRDRRRDRANHPPPQAIAAKLRREISNSISKSDERATNGEETETRGARCMQINSRLERKVTRTSKFPRRSRVLHAALTIPRRRSSKPSFNLS